MDRIPCVGWFEVLLPGSWECCQQQMTFEFCWRDETWSRSGKRLIDMQRPASASTPATSVYVETGVFTD